MKKQDWVTKELAAYGFRSEISACGYWVEVSYDYNDEGRWELFSSRDSIMSYLRLNALI